MTEPVVYTTFDKAKRDELWRELRTRGRRAERQAVRFSGNEQAGTLYLGTVIHKRWVKGEDGDYMQVPFQAWKTRPIYRSTWSVSHPAEIETKTGEN